MTYYDLEDTVRRQLPTVTVTKEEIKVLAFLTSLTLEDNGDMIVLKQPNSSVNIAIFRRQDSNCYRPIVGVYPALQFVSKVEAGRMFTVEFCRCDGFEVMVGAHWSKASRLLAKLLFGKDFIKVDPVTLVRVTTGCFVCGNGDQFLLTLDEWRDELQRLQIHADSLSQVVNTVEPAP